MHDTRNPYHSDLKGDTNPGLNILPEFVNYRYIHLLPLSVPLWRHVSINILNSSFKVLEIVYYGDELLKIIQDTIMSVRNKLDLQIQK